MDLHRLIRALSLGLLATCAGVGLLPSSAEAQQPTLVGSVHGMVVADVPSAGGGDNIPLPNARVTVADAATTASRGETFTTLAGRFSTPLQPAGTYRVCATAPGFAQSCSQPVQITTDSVSLKQLLALKPQNGVLYGRVSLQDGTPAVRLDAGLGMTAGAAQVSLADAEGHAVAGPVSVDAGSQYVLAPVVAGSNLVLSARYEGVSTSQTISLSKTDLDTGKPVDVTLSGAAPKVTSIAMTQDGKPITSAVAGSTVTLTVNAQDSGPLHYSWTSNIAGLAAKDAPVVTITLPKSPVGTVVFVEITNGKGGVARGSITIPLTATSTLERQIEIKPNNIAGPALIPIKLCVIFIYCIPQHQGPFIDPTLLMEGACNSEASCETEATAYYKAIGALAANGTPTQTGTLEGWKTAFGFGADPNSPTNGEVRATYYNNADLGFGRDMHCRTIAGALLFSHTVACYVSNYGDGTKTFGSDPQTAIGRAGSNTGRLATVAMVYSFSTLGIIGHPLPPQVDRVSFYVFSNNNPANPTDPNDGKLVTSAILDGEGAKAVPGLCLDCHGGQYDPAAHKAQKANFLPFDAPSFIFGISQRALLDSSQREAIRQLNAMVKSATYARPTISQLIDGWYQWCGGVGTNGCYIDDVSHPFYPNQPCPAGDQSGVSCGWPPTWGGALAQSFYQHIPRFYCRTCHVAQANFLNVDSFDDWKAQAPLIKQYVLSSYYMPFAQRPYDAFWDDFASQSAMAPFLNATGP
jgi:Carboxypeptidase regulatory-like domain